MLKKKIFKNVYFFFNLCYYNVYILFYCVYRFINWQVVVICKIDFMVLVMVGFWNLKSNINMNGMKNFYSDYCFICVGYDNVVMLW